MNSNNKKKKIYLIKPRGFCMGVNNALSIVEKTLEKYKPPIYLHHQIVHNEVVIKNLEKKGVIFCKDIDSIPDNSIIILSAHGSKKETIKKASKKAKVLIDAVCPFVKRIHKRAIELNSQGFSLILIGKKSHKEVIATKSYADMIVIEKKEDIKKIDSELFNKKITYLTQTTLSYDDTKELIKELIKKYPNITKPKKEDICFATQSRQDAVKNIGNKCDCIIVFGSKNSSNTKNLLLNAKKYCDHAFMVLDKNNLDLSIIDKHDVIGITSGASSPECVIEDFLAEIKKKYDEVSILEE